MVQGQNSVSHHHPHKQSHPWWCDQLLELFSGEFCSLSRFHQEFCFYLMYSGWCTFFVRGVLLSWDGSLVAKKRRKVWNIASLCLFWSIWRERNRRTFENCESLDQTIKSSFLYLFWDWVRLSIGDGVMSPLDFVDWLGSL